MAVTLSVLLSRTLLKDFFRVLFCVEAFSLENSTATVPAKYFKLQRKKEMLWLLTFGLQKTPQPTETSSAPFYNAVKFHEVIGSSSRAPVVKKCHSFPPKGN